MQGQNPAGPLSLGTAHIHSHSRCQSGSEGTPFPESHLAGLPAGADPEWSGESGGASFETEGVRFLWFCFSPWCQSEPTSGPPCSSSHCKSDGSRLLTGGQCSPQDQLSYALATSAGPGGQWSPPVLPPYLEGEQRDKEKWRRYLQCTAPGIMMDIN